MIKSYVVVRCDRALCAASVSACICGVAHFRGHFGAVGTHRCLACGYTGQGGVMLDDGETEQAPGGVT